MKLFRYAALTILITVTACASAPPTPTPILTEVEKACATASAGEDAFVLYNDKHPVGPVVGAKVRVAIANKARVCGHYPLPSTLGDLEWDALKAAIATFTTATGN